MHREVGRAKDLSAPLYSVLYCVYRFFIVSFMYVYSYLLLV
jgi:hypothetical protein